MNQTEHFALNQWELSDRIQMEDFNADNAKIDTALHAEQTARESAVSALQTALNGKGNCQIVTGSYAGTGKYGASNPKTLSFPAPPMLVIIRDSNSGDLNTTFTIVRGAANANGYTAGSANIAYLTWSGSTVSWYNTNSAAGAYNASGHTYYYIALLAQN